LLIRCPYIALEIPLCGLSNFTVIQLPSAFPPPCPNLSEAPEPQVRWVSKS
jgi:hypothetical protein